MTDAQPFPVEEALAELAMLEQHHDACCTAIGDERDIDESFARLAATLRQLSAPRPVPAPIGELIDRLEEAWNERDFACGHENFPPGRCNAAIREVAAARAALEAALEPSEEAITEFIRGYWPTSDINRLKAELMGGEWSPTTTRYDLLRGSVNFSLKLAYRAQFAPSARPETVSDHGTNDPHLEGEVPLSERAARPEPGAGREP